jgi:hypothetical protein
MVLVIGIFIGLQVDDWYKERNDRREEAVYIDRLGVEFESNIQEMDKQEQIHTTNSIRLKQAIEWVQQGRTEFNAEEVDVMERGLCRWFMPFPLELNFGTYEELISTGKLTILRDDELRSALQAFHTDYKRLQTHLYLPADYWADLGKSLWAYLQYLPSKDWDRGTSCEIDFQKLAETPDVLSTMTLLESNEYFVGKQFRDVLQGSAAHLKDKLD